MQGVGTNRYAYSANDPVNKSDRNGHQHLMHGHNGGPEWDPEEDFEIGDYHSPFEYEPEIEIFSPNPMVGDNGVAAFIGAAIIVAQSVAKERSKVEKGDVGRSPTVGQDASKSHLVTKDGPSDLRRPYIRKAVRQEVEAAAERAPDGRLIDPNTFQPIKDKPDLGHKYGYEFWRERGAAQSQGLNQKQFNNRMNDSKKYQLEDRSSNRSHRYEKPR